MFYGEKFLRDSVVCRMREIIGVLGYDIAESLLRGEKG
jgi:hypothetical protein